MTYVESVPVSSVSFTMNLSLFELRSGWNRTVKTVTDTVFVT